MDPANCRATLSTCRRRPATSVSVDGESSAVALVLFAWVQLPTSMLSLYAFMGASMYLWLLARNSLACLMKQDARGMPIAMLAGDPNPPAMMKSSRLSVDEFPAPQVEVPLAAVPLAKVPLTSVTSVQLES